MSLHLDHLPSQALDSNNQTESQSVAGLDFQQRIDSLCQELEVVSNTPVLVFFDHFKWFIYDKILLLLLEI